MKTLMSCLLLLIVLVAPVGAQPVLKVVPQPPYTHPAPLTDTPTWQGKIPSDGFSYDSPRTHTVGLSVDGPDGRPFVVGTFPDLPACEWARTMALKRPQSPAYVCGPLAK